MPPAGAPLRKGLDMARERSTTTEQVIAGAASTFLEKGYRKSTMDDVARAVGVTKPTIYNYANNKQWLLERIVSTVCDELDGELERVYRLNVSAEERIYELIHVHVAATVKYQEFYHVLFSEEVELSASARREFRVWARTVTHGLQSLLEQCRSEGTLGARIRPDLAAQLITSMLASLHRWYLPEGDVSPEQLVDEIAHLLGGAITFRRLARITMP